MCDIRLTLSSSLLTHHFIHPWTPPFLISFMFLSMFLITIPHLNSLSLSPRWFMDFIKYCMLWSHLCTPIFYLTILLEFPCSLTMLSHEDSLGIKSGHLYSRQMGSSDFTTVSRESLSVLKLSVTLLPQYATEYCQQCAEDENDPKSGTNVGKIMNLMPGDVNRVSGLFPRSWLWSHVLSSSLSWCRAFFPFMVHRSNSSLGAHPCTGSWPSVPILLGLT